MLTITLDGNSFNSLTTFYDEVERKMTHNLDWKIGRNLDAFNDVLRGGFGVHSYEEPFQLIWENSTKSKTDLGWNETVRYYENMLESCHPDNIPYVKDKVAAAKRKEGPTVFEEIVEIIRGHEHIQLELK
jgi:RNAse (barnase) inhibitor barstar